LISVSAQLERREKQQGDKLQRDDLGALEVSTDKRGQGWGGPGPNPRLGKTPVTARPLCTLLLAWKTPRREKHPTDQFLILGTGKK